MSDQSGLFSGGAIPPEAMGGLPAPIVAVSIGRSTWQGAEDHAPRPAPRYTIAPLAWSATVIYGGDLEARALGMRYMIRQTTVYPSRWSLSRDHGDNADFASIDAAKAAAQADFDWHMDQWVRPALPAGRIVVPAQVSTEMLLAQLDSRLARQGFPEVGMVRTMLRGISVDLRALKGGA